MSKKKIIIIGGSGSIGSSIAKEIIKDEFEPHLIGRNYASLKKISDELKCPYSVADVTKSKDLIEALNKCGDNIFGLAYCAGSIDLKSLTLAHENDYIESFKFNYPHVFNTESFQATYSLGDIIAVHPTQIYEMMLYFFIYLFLNKMLDKKHFKGEIFMNYLFLAGFARFMVEFIRVNPKYFLDLSGAQIISVAMMMCAIVFHYYSRVYRKDAKN